jgi:hypothetical protein
VYERERDNVCVCDRESESVCVCVCVGEGTQKLISYLQPSNKTFLFKKLKNLEKMKKWKKFLLKGLHLSRL